MEKLEFLVLTGRWFTPGYREGFTAASGIASKLIEYDEQEIGSVLETLKDRGLLSLVDLDEYHRRRRVRIKDPGEPYYRPTPDVWREREKLLHERGMRHVVLTQQDRHSLKNIIVALLMSERIENKKIKGPFVGTGSRKQLIELQVYLYKFSEAEITQACADLVSDGMARFEKIKVEEEVYEGIDLTTRGETYHKRTTMNVLGLREEENILDIAERDEITVFWAWQSDFSQSRNAIEEKLDQVIAKANKEWSLVARLRKEIARDVGEGSLRIDVALEEKIKESDFFVADFTPIFQYQAKLYPNPNVLVEAGFALASKEPGDIFLVECLRHPKDVPGDQQDNPKFPFDIGHIHRTTYKKPADLKNKLLRDFKARLEKRGLLFPASDG